MGAGRIPRYDESSDGNKIISEIDPESLIVSSQQCEKIYGLQSMDEYVDNVSMYCADLSEDSQTAKSKQSFMDYPLEILSKVLSELRRKFKMYLDMDQYLIGNGEKSNPLNPSGNLDVRIYKDKSWISMSDSMTYPHI